MQVESSIHINAPAQNIWQVLTDPESLLKGTGILRLEGKIALGAKFKLWSEIAPKRAFALRVAVFEENQRMVWQGGMPFGLFTGTRTFTLRSEASETAFHMKEFFTGPMAPMITKSMPDLQPSFDTFAAAVKAISEGEKT